MPRQFSWIDQRLVRDRHMCGRTHRALSLYLFLCTVADAEGTSYYSEAKTGELLGCSTGELREARSELARAGLIAYRCPFYQVLSLEAQAMAATPALGAPQPRSGESLSIGAILRAMGDAK